MSKRVTFMRVEDGWYAVYFDDKLHDATDDKSLHQILSFLRAAFVIGDNVEDVSANGDLDSEISNNGEFPQILDRDRIYNR